MKTLFLLGAAAAFAQYPPLPPCPTLPMHSRIIDPAGLLSPVQTAKIEREIRKLPYNLYLYLADNIPNYFRADGSYAAGEMLDKCARHWRLVEFGDRYSMVLLVGTKQRQWATTRGNEVYSLAPYSPTIEAAFGRFYEFQAKSRKDFPGGSRPPVVPKLYEGLLLVIKQLQDDAPEKP